MKMSLTSLFIRNIGYYIVGYSGHSCCLTLTVGQFIWLGIESLIYEFINSQIVGVMSPIYINPRRVRWTYP